MRRMTMSVSPAKRRAPDAWSRISRLRSGWSRVLISGRGRAGRMAGTAENAVVPATNYCHDAWQPCRRRRDDSIPSHRPLESGRRAVAGAFQHALGDLALAQHHQAGPQPVEMLDGGVGMGARQDLERRIDRARLLDHLAR